MTRTLKIQYTNIFFPNNPNLIKKLIEMKNKITNNAEWDNAKKMSNDYELIYQPNKKIRQTSIAKYHPISRSFFKLWEMIHDFDLIKSSNKYKILCLAEGPGGFIEAILKFRKDIKDDIWGITLKSSNKDVPDWKKSYKFLKNNKINLSYGRDNTGNLYNLDNIIYLKYQIKDKVDFITGDGGFDFSSNFNNQEQSSYRIIYAQIVSALTMQKIGGDFVVKIFDINTENTIKMIYLLYHYYDEIYITKPLTSRPANSEKYIVCKSFNGIEDHMLALFQNRLTTWDESFISFVTLPKWFIKLVTNYNQTFIQNQIENIDKTLKIINNKFIHKKNQQLENAIKWCKKYNVEII